MQKIYIINVGGCVERWLDANKIQYYLEKNGYEIVNEPKDADTIVAVTCAVFNDVSNYTLITIKNFQKYDAELIIAGCLPAIDEAELSKIFHGVTLTTKELEQKIEKIFPPKNNIKFSEIDDANIVVKDFEESRSIDLFEKIRTIVRNFYLRNLYGKESLSYKYFTEKSKVYHIRVSRGCFGNCSFCATKKAIGPFVSKPFDECMKEFRTGLKQGYKDFIITSDDPGAYGIDIGSSLPGLLDEMTKIEDGFNINISGISPERMIKYIDDFIEILKRRKITSILFPIQSGNSRILKLMNRYSDVEQMKKTFLRLKESFPDLLLEIQCIVGFPSETWEEFEQTLNFIIECNIDFGYIYTYSCRSGTEAEKIEPKVSQKEISKRMKYAKKYFSKNDYKLSHLKLGISGGTYIFHLNEKK